MLFQQEPGIVGQSLHNKYYVILSSDLALWSVYQFYFFSEKTDNHAL
jgi:hypothetical protein